MEEQSSNPEKPNLFTLPQELRDLIYEFACENVTATIKSTMPISSTDPVSTSSLQDSKIPLTSRNSNIGILQVCRQIRSEATPIYFRHTIFAFASPRACVTWLKHHISIDQIACLERVRISEPGDDRVLQELKHEIADESHGRERDAAFVKSFLAWTIATRAAVTLRAVRDGLGIREHSVLGRTVLQVMVVNRRWEFVWTGEPYLVEAPE